MKNETNLFVWFLGESTARQSAYGFISPLVLVWYVSTFCLHKKFLSRNSKNKQSPCRLEWTVKVFATFFEQDFALNILLSFGLIEINISKYF